ncbi:3-demethylubiquinone-9 3-methyltransferase [Rhodopseudomonas palustris BisB5]|uniref:3-demethylubiquinone-9 3-methyltransferase n=1 Tax=Rhodopseudomonas palustris (strain BisB5) TaxID=316057 RepID=Q131E5_RHOPS|nr:3-demethylubiquinone-9 3-methyltransferase [Rhodopseudomonas palustris BisB5]
MSGSGDHIHPRHISFKIDCADQAEVDRLWDALLNGGTPDRCGWLRDRYGRSRQIVPSILPKLFSGAPFERVRNG